MRASDDRRSARNQGVGHGSKDSKFGGGQSGSNEYRMRPTNLSVRVKCGVNRNRCKSFE
jgi:hypothetical protein